MYNEHGQVAIMKDPFNRDIEYMRISITDRCNLRCRYCMPAEGIEKISMSQILTYEEILRVCRHAVSLGITRFKVTGGEPLVRRGCAGLIRTMKEIPGTQQVTLTTNGQLLEQHLDDLKAAGPDGINVSLDSLQEDRYRTITRGGELKPVLSSIAKVTAAGIPTKVNCLLQKELNEDEYLAFARMAFDQGIPVRFIEIMPVGFADAGEGLSNEDILLLLQKKWPQLTPDDRIHGNGPAVYYRIPGQPGAIGLISAMHGKFCDRCNRIRLTSQGKIQPCLCYEDAVDLLPVLRGGSEDELRETMAAAVMTKPPGHCFDERKASAGKSMVEIGG